MSELKVVPRHAAPDPTPAAEVRPITIAITAIGGQSGGVLADWIVDLAGHEGYIAQYTSVAGVAQRTIYKNIYPSQVKNLVAGQAPPNSGSGQNLGNDDANGVRVQVQVEPTSKLTVRAVGSYYNDVYSENAYNSAATVPVFNGQGQLVNAVFAGPAETRLGIGPGGADYSLAGAPTTATRPVAGGDAFGFVAERPEPHARPRLGAGAAGLRPHL